jgi:bifunctional pyridoxal-dependent enzyme with beta-cystathionase and maltose regulon repressor activities
MTGMAYRTAATRAACHCAPVTLCDQLEDANLDVDSFYLAWLDWRRIGDGGQPRNVSLDRGRVALEPGPPFGSPESGFVRLNVVRQAVLAEAIERIASAPS